MFELRKILCMILMPLFISAAPNETSADIILQNSTENILEITVSKKSRQYESEKKLVMQPNHVVKFRADECETIWLSIKPQNSYLAASQHRIEHGTGYSIALNPDAGITLTESVGLFFENIDYTIPDNSSQECTATRAYCSPLCYCLGCCCACWCLCCKPSK